jgi:ribosomal protein L29
MKTDYSLLEAALIGYQHQRELLAAKIAEIQRQLGDAPASASAESPKKRVMNAAARKRIAQAQRKRWAEFHKTKGTTTATKKRTMSPEGRERIAEATRKRWAEFRAQKAAANKPGKKAGKRAVKRASAAASEAEMAAS